MDLPFWDGEFMLATSSWSTKTSERVCAMEGGEEEGHLYSLQGVGMSDSAWPYRVPCCWRKNSLSEKSLLITPAAYKRARTHLHSQVCKLKKTQDTIYRVVL